METTRKTIRLLLSGLFLLSGLTKVWSVKSFAMEVALYLDAYMGGLFRNDAPVLASGLCAGELLLGLWGLTGRHSALASAATLAVLSFFVWLTGTNLFFPSPMGSIESCGCFGELVHFTPTASFAKSVLLWAVSLVWLILECHRQTLTDNR